MPVARSGEWAASAVGMNAPGAMVQEADFEELLRNLRSAFAAACVVSVDDVPQPGQFVWRFEADAPAGGKQWQRYDWWHQMRLEQAYRAGEHDVTYRPGRRFRYRVCFHQMQQQRLAYSHHANPRMVRRRKADEGPPPPEDLVVDDCHVQ